MSFFGKPEFGWKKKFRMQLTPKIKCRKMIDENNKGRNMLVCIEKTETKNAERKNIGSGINAASAHV